MSIRTRLLSLSTVALLLAPVRGAAGQAVADYARPLHLLASAGVPSDSAAPLLARALVERVPTSEGPSFGSTVPVRPLSQFPAATSQQARPSLGRTVAWGAVIGAAAGTLTGLTVLAMCDSYCEGTPRGRGLALHIGVGAVVGGAIGALVHQLRD